jgi:phosphatidylinositol alpha-1,6-mannosyltransferase
MGGINTYAREIAKYFVSKGKEVVVVTKEYTDYKPYPELEEGYRIIRLDDQRWKQKKYNLIKGVIKKYDSKDTLFLGTNWKMSVPMFFLSLVQKINYVTAIHGLDVHEGRKINRILQLSTYRRTKIITYASSYTKSILDKESIQQPVHFVMNNGFDDKAFYPDINIKEIESKYGLKSERYIFCFGRLVERKGFDKTIEAISKVDNIDLIIAGTGEYQGMLEEIAISTGCAERVNFVGKVTDDDLRILYSSALAYSMPSRTVGGWDFEGFGITYLEAAACGTLSIGGRGSGAEDAIEDGVTGYLVNPNDTDDITRCIERLIANDHTAMEQKAMERANSKFTWEMVVGRLATEIDRL